MLEVNDLSVSFSSYTKGLRRKEACAIRSLDLRVQAGEVVAVVGQSGAGKSLLAHALLRILPRNARITGSMLFKGRELTPARAKKIRGREMALIPQSVAYLNPLLRVGVQIARSARLNGLAAQDARQGTLEALKRYGLEQKIAQWFPFQLSGGMARRVLTATATVGAADLLLADEPTNGLDADIARESLRHLRELADTGKAVVLITHDIEAALEVADKVTVFCGGITVEEAHAQDFNGHSGLRHPYSQALWASLPCNRFMEDLPVNGKAKANGGCPFTHRCDACDSTCAGGLPELVAARGGKVRCWRA